MTSWPTGISWHGSPALGKRRVKVRRRVTGCPDIDPVGNPIDRAVEMQPLGEAGEWQVGALGVDPSTIGLVDQESGRRGRRNTPARTPGPRRLQRGRDLLGVAQIHR